MKTTVTLEEAFERLGYMNFLMDKLNSLCDTVRKQEKEARYLHLPGRVKTGERNHG